MRQNKTLETKVLSFEEKKDEHVVSKIIEMNKSIVQSQQSRQSASVKFFHSFCSKKEKKYLEEVIFALFVSTVFVIWIAFYLPSYTKTEERKAKKRFQKFLRP